MGRRRTGHKDIRHEIAALFRVIETRSEHAADEPEQTALWRQIRRAWEAGMLDDRMKTALAAFEELVDDATVLADPEMQGHFGAAVKVQIERDGFGYPSVDVDLSQIEGSQLQFVLNVARKYELDVREESGWLRLTHHLNSDDMESDDEPAEVVEA
jgi:hypothetical protein